MATEEQNLKEDKKTIYQSLRESILPVKPTDSEWVKAGKTAGFFIFSIFASLISLLIGIVAAFAL